MLKKITDISYQTFPFISFQIRCFPPLNPCMLSQKVCLSECLRKDDRLHIFWKDSLIIRTRNIIQISATRRVVNYLISKYLPSFAEHSVSFFTGPQQINSSLRTGFGSLMMFGCGEIVILRWRIMITPPPHVN